MKLYFWIILLLNIVHFTLQHEIITNVVHVKSKNPWSEGFWQKKYKWKARWVKTWVAKKVYVPLWKKVWGPIEVNEWIPLPKLHPKS